MTSGTTKALKIIAIPAAIITYVIVSGTTGFCPMCEAVVNTVGTNVGIIPVAHQPASTPSDEPDTPEAEPADPAEPEFKQMKRPGSVDINETYDTSNPQIPLDEVHSLLPKDAIPSLTDPAFEPVADSDWLTDDARVIVLEGKEAAFAVPLTILDSHEVVNIALDGKPIAATYCPLCDSATVISRTVTHNGEEQVLEFGVSGALYNSNVLMYDRTHNGLWSQLGMRAVTGPLAGTKLDHLPVRIWSWKRFRLAHPDGSVLSKDTGHQRPYGKNVYERYFSSDNLMVPVRDVGDALEQKKTLGLGVLAGGNSYFIPHDAIGEDGYTLSTPMGDVTVEFQDGGIDVTSAPEGVHTAQTFYYSWSAFNHNTKVIPSDS